jgi:hypothetical protein
VSLFESLRVRRYYHQQQRELFEKTIKEIRQGLHEK